MASQMQLEMKEKDGFENFLCIPFIKDEMVGNLHTTKDFINHFGNLSDVGKLNYLIQSIQNFNFHPSQNQHIFMDVSKENYVIPINVARFNMSFDIWTSNVVSNIIPLCEDNMDLKKMIAGFIIIELGHNIELLSSASELMIEKNEYVYTWDIPKVLFNRFFGIKVLALIYSKWFSDVQSSVEIQDVCSEITKNNFFWPKIKWNEQCKKFACEIFGVETLQGTVIQNNSQMIKTGHIRYSPRYVDKFYTMCGKEEVLISGISCYSLFLELYIYELPVRTFVTLFGIWLNPNLKVEDYFVPMVTDDSIDDITHLCTICLEQIIEGGMKTNECNHYFHSSCLFKMFKADWKGKCPNCRQKINKVK